ncbi:MAG: hypothetical protein EA384_13325 [Spirochaetaceae bacterium]|nr:MAG: hypothetical protein EA384_13325 [Spirochaetaceae bacterium]
MKREDFIFTIGFEGNTAVVDSRCRKRYRTLSTIALAEKGLYRQAFCSALFSGDTREMEHLLEYMREYTSFDASSEIALKRLFGVFEVPKGITRTLSV